MAQESIRKKDKWRNLFISTIYSTVPVLLPAGTEDWGNVKLPSAGKIMCAFVNDRKPHTKYGGTLILEQINNF